MKKILALLSAIVCTSTANAQVVQPSYTRPAKGASLTIFNQAANSAFTPVASALMDWSAFYGAAITVERADTSGCLYGVEVSVYGLSSAAAVPANWAMTMQPLFVENAIHKAPYNDSWFVRVTTPYMFIGVKPFVIQGAGLGCTQPVTVKITPTPFDYSIQFGRNNFEAVLFSGAVTDPYRFPVVGVTPQFFGLNKRLPYTRLQNLGTQPILCSPAYTNQSGGTGTPDVYPIHLAAASGANNGTGGVFVVENYTGGFWCKTASSTSEMGLFQY